MECTKAVLNGHRMLKKPSKRSWCTCKNIVLSLIISLILLQVINFSKYGINGGGSLFMFSFSSHFHEKKIFSTPLVKQFNSIIVMSSNPRTGSSFTGELVSSSSDSSYFFEPLWYYIDTKQARPPTIEDKKSLLMNLLKCNFHDPRIKKMIFSNKQSTFIFRKPSIAGLKYDRSKVGRMGFLKRLEIKCRKTKTRVVKTIRMNMSEMQSILDELPEEGRVSQKNFHVIYLVRDPRGILNSVTSLKEQWPEKLMDPSHICNRIKNDTNSLSRHVKERNLLVLRYEDIAFKPEEHFQRIAKHFNISVDNNVAKFLQTHSSVKWRNKTTSGTSQLNKSTAKTENPLGEIMMDIARQKQFKLETDIVEKDTATVRIEQKGSHFENVELEESSGDEIESDYYDSKGKLMTVRKRRSVSGLGLVKNILKEKPAPASKGFEADPEGHSYYFSTYRKSNFDPDHWKTSLPRNLTEAVQSDKTCQYVLNYFNYSIISY